MPEDLVQRGLGPDLATGSRAPSRSLVVGHRGRLGVVVLGREGATEPIPPAPSPAPLVPHGRYRKPRRIVVKADASTTVPCPSLAVGTDTGLAVGTCINWRTAETGVPGPR
jgi:hypothetical protein